MTFDERLKEIFKNYKLHHKDIDACFHDHVAESAIIAAIKQAMREMKPKRKEVYTNPNENIQASNHQGYNTAINEIEKGFGL